MGHGSFVNPAPPPIHPPPHSDWLRYAVWVSAEQLIAVAWNTGTANLGQQMIAN